MKKSFFFAIMIAMIAVFTACKKDSKKIANPGPGVTIMTDSVVCVTTEPITAPRYGCGGMVLSEPKLVGFDYLENVIPPKEKHISDSVLKAAGYVYSKGLKTGDLPNATKKDLPISDSGSGLSKMFDILGPVLWFLLGLVIFLLALFLAAWVIKQLINAFPGLFKKTSQNDSHNTPEEVPIRLADLSEEEKKNLTSSIKQDVMSELEKEGDLDFMEDRLFYEHIVTLTKQLQETGGKVDTLIGNCTYMIDIPAQKQKKE